MATPQPPRTSLSDNPRIAFVDVEVLCDVLPQLFEDSSTPGEVKTGEERVGNCLGDDIRGRARHELNNARWDAGLLQQLVNNVIGVGRGG